jgi:putative MATE family efflux protein
MTGLYLRTILVMHALNIFLNWVLIFGNLGAPKMGVSGAALATSISLVVGTFIYFFLAWRHARPHGFLHRLPSRKTLAAQFRLSLPTSIQQLLFSGGMVALFWILGRIGTEEVAAGNILMMFMLVALLPAMAIGISASTLVGNALGRKDLADARLWGWNATVLAMLYGICVSLVLFIAGKPLLGVFLINPVTQGLAYIPLMLMAAVMAVDLAGLTVMHGLFGAGDTKTPAMISVVGQWFVFLPIAYIVGPILGLGLVGVWAAQGVYRFIQAILFMKVWQRGRWAKLKI